MKSVNILIPNYNSFEAIQLCIESIRHYTRYPNYKIIVFDDHSWYCQDPDSDIKQPNMVDLGYLRDCHARGWIELHENPGPQSLSHGGAVNKLIHEYCDADYAMILDCDTQVKMSGWLTEMVRVAEADPKILTVADFKDSGFTPKYYRTGLYLCWFQIIKMAAYNDGMQVNWKLSKHDVRKHPYDKEFTDFYPPENCKLTYYWNQHCNKDEFDASLVVNDPASHLYLQIKYFNPKGYRAVSLPPHVKQMYHHYAHMSFISVPGSYESQVAIQRERKLRMISLELARLRGNG